MSCNLIIVFEFDINAFLYVAIHSRSSDALVRSFGDLFRD